ncbi:magnesium transporter [Ferrimonas gelatinilytica]|uniref:Magnesium transporter n=1 Tax=Ferrimonas gelatinilytica TaxID=1255257 RepID=A0ABP9RZI2_9GAMM
MTTGSDPRQDGVIGDDTGPGVSPEGDTWQSLTPAVAARLLRGKAPIYIHEKLSELPHEQALLVASMLTGERSMTDESELATEAITLASPTTVADLLSPPVGVVGPETTVAGALDYLVHTLPVTGITYLYIVDKGQRLLGVVVMRELLLASPGQTMEEIMTPEPFALSPETPIFSAILSALKRHYRLYPVTDGDGKLVGLVFGWQLFEQVARETMAQSGSMVGISKEERLVTPVREAFVKRHPWLQVNLLTAFAAAFVVGLFEDTIAQIVALAVFLPVLAGQSGNTGSQALAITLRGMTLGELANFPIRRLLAKEIALGALNGLFVGVVAAVAMSLYAWMTGAASPLMLGLVVLIAMVGACVGSGLFGVLVPLTLKRFGADPAMASSIFLSTFTDILGMGLMLMLATVMVL